MQATRSAIRTILAPVQFSKVFVPTAGLKSPAYRPPPDIHPADRPEKNRLKIQDKTPKFPPGTRVFTMQKRLADMRGLETVHNTFLYKQYGIVALSGGRLKHVHMEVIRLKLIKFADLSRVFAVWRVDAPWHPVSKKGQGQRMGGGKGTVHHYVTPVKQGRVIIEVAGNAEYAEVKRALDKIVATLPFKAAAFSHEELEASKAREKQLEDENLHPYTWRYMVQNNMLGCHQWIKPIDKAFMNKCV